MAEALLCSLNDGKNNFKYNMGKIYSSNPAKNVSLRIKKETGNEFKGKNILGLQAVTGIKKGVVIGYFVLKKVSKSPEDDITYCVQKGVGKKKKYLVMHEESLMNKINTFVDPKKRKESCNVKIINPNAKGLVGVRTLRNIKRGEMLYTCYNSVSHYDKIKWQVCKSKVQKNNGQKRKATPNTEDEDNDYTCWRCNRRTELVMCDLCPRSICMSCLDIREERLMNGSNFFCKECLDNPPAHPNRFVKKKQKIIMMTPSEKINKWLKKTHNKYCSSTDDLPDNWKVSKSRVIKLFKAIRDRKLFSNTEFVNFAGNRTNKEHPWDIEIVEALIGAISRENSHVYGINLGEIYFTTEALIYLHLELPRTYVGWIYIAEELNLKNKPSLVGLFRRGKRINKRKYPNGSNLVANRKERPAWYKNGSIAPWYDGIDNKTLLEKDETMAKTFWGSHNSRYYVTKFGTKFGQVMGL